MNILLISHYAGSSTLGMLFRPYYLGKEWIKQGHRLCVVSASYSHLRNNQPNVPKDFTVEIIEEIKYIWLKTPRYSSNGIKRFLSMIVFVLKLYKYKHRIIQEIKPNAVIASSTYPFDIYPAFSIAKKSKAKLCYEVRDLWPLTPMIIGGFSKWNPFIMLMQAGENFACKKSDVIVSVLDNAKTYLMEHGMAAEKFHYIPNGFVMSEYLDRGNLPENLDKFISLLKQQNKILVGYAGGFKPSNAVHVLIEAANKLKTNKDIAFILVGKGIEYDRLNKIIKDNNMENVFIFEPINKNSVLSFLRKMDILYTGGVNSELHKHGISPIKLVDYMLSAKPFVLSANLAENNWVTRFSIGRIVPAEDSYSVANAIENLIKCTEQERIEMGKKGFDYAYNNLNYEILSKNFIQALS